MTEKVECVWAVQQGKPPVAPCHQPSVANNLGRSVFLAVSCLRASVKTRLRPIWPRRLLRSSLVGKQEKEILTARGGNELQPLVQQLHFAACTDGPEEKGMKTEKDTLVLCNEAMICFI